MTLSYDICRCSGVKDESNRSVTPCATCRRMLEQGGPRSPWFMEPPLKNGLCEHVIPVH